ncbi:FMN-binding negative transcriptional regulator [Guyparkeria halophila]|uniref:FMN-binding negative transcriptional regulator n=1 Tax=Guyparkeria halophila TaxID=47960 RepID=A0A6I6D373_9GAMM|nr:FMN-binding negative transcriptional regulator [Guyparkeria halophila]QGT78383.1 FMN-binding negative transcriptional regulator [Guyparkeria halophila]
MTVGTYIPPYFRQDDPAVIAEVVATHPFAALVLADKGQMPCVHLPFLRFGEATRPDTWRFESHLARANPVAEALADGRELSAILIFTGPDAYVSPRWYVDAHDTSVPTWNYQTVHVRGRVRLAGEGDPEWLDRHLHDLIDTHQARIGGDPFDWDHLPERQIAGMKAAIVGIELLPERIEGIEKLAQNKTAADQDGVIEGLHRRGDAECDAMADLMRARDRG